MDRNLPPRITYWTGIWEPRREALSREVETLRDALAPHAPVVSFSPGQRSSFVPWDFIVRLSGRRWLLLRALAAVLERRGSVTHVFGSLDDWHLLRSLGRRPLIFTVAISGRSPDRRLLKKATVVVAESEPLRRAIEDAGVPASRVRLIYPGVDLRQFAPVAAPPPTPFRILFASTPADPAEFERRGIPLLVELARLCPDTELVLLWRRWGNEKACRLALDALAPPDNLRVEFHDVNDMAAMFQSVHATVIGFAEGFGKSCPNSIVESLACGRPALVADTCGIAELIDKEGAGVVSERTPEAMRAALQRLRLGYQAYSRSARALAESSFDVSKTVTEYSRLYLQLASAGRRGRLSLTMRRAAASDGRDA
jgi:glycosyltransferase involved in cell wall biosynthesis